MTLTCVEALGDGGGIDEEATAKSTADVGVELVEGDLRLLRQTQRKKWSSLVCRYTSEWLPFFFSSEHCSSVHYESIGSLMLNKHQKHNCSEDSLAE